jgi:hypothetical protein
MKWTGTGIMDKEKHVILCNGHQKKHEFGLGFLVNNRIKNSIIGFTPINHRLRIIKIAKRFFNYSFINAHTPVEDTDDGKRMISMKYLRRPLKNVQDMI